MVTGTARAGRSSVSCTPRVASTRSESGLRNAYAPATRTSNVTNADAGTKGMKNGMPSKYGALSTRRPATGVANRSRDMPVLTAPPAPGRAKRPACRTQVACRAPTPVKPGSVWCTGTAVTSRALGGPPEAKGNATASMAVTLHRMQNMDSCMYSATPAASKSRAGSTVQFSGMISRNCQAPVKSQLLSTVTPDSGYEATSGIHSPPMPLGVGDGVGVALALGVPLGLGVGDGVADGVPDPVALGLGLGLAQATIQAPARVARDVTSSRHRPPARTRSSDTVPNRGSTLGPVVHVSSTVEPLPVEVTKSGTRARAPDTPRGVRLARVDTQPVTGPGNAITATAAPPVVSEPVKDTRVGTDTYTTVAHTSGPAELDTSVAAEVNTPGRMHTVVSAPATGAQLTRSTRADTTFTLPPLQPVNRNPDTAEGQPHSGFSSADPELEADPDTGTMSMPTEMASLKVTRNEGGAQVSPACRAATGVRATVRGGRDGDGLGLTLVLGLGLAPGLPVMLGLVLALSLTLPLALWLTLPLALSLGLALALAVALWLTLPLALSLALEVALWLTLPLALSLGLAVAL